MNPAELSKEIEMRYRRYLETTFFFKAPELRASFKEALASGALSKGPYLEATPVFKTGATFAEAFERSLGEKPDAEVLRPLEGDRPLYRHQEEALTHVAGGKNVIVATGTGSGKTECFLYPIILSLYKEFVEEKLCSGVRALILYPMNALANDQRDRLGTICRRLEEGKSPFGFTFGQYTGETPEDKGDTRRRAQAHIENRLPGELVFRAEMRDAPPHILLTNYSMLEYLLLRPDDSPLFDNGNAMWWSFIVLDEAHQYRGTKGIEMAMLLRRLKQRLREGGSSGPLRCIATSATLMGGEEDKQSVAEFASSLFGEPFSAENVILGETENIPNISQFSLGPEQYRKMRDCLNTENEAADSLLALAEKLRVPHNGLSDKTHIIGSILQRDKRSAELRNFVTGNAVRLEDLAEKIFSDAEKPTRLDALANLTMLLVKARAPESGAPLFSARYHLFLRSLEGAFLAFQPKKKIYLDRQADGAPVVFEIALCRECGQHYIVGKKDNNMLREAVRDPGRDDFGTSYFLPEDAVSEQDDEDTAPHENIFRLCVQCGAICRDCEDLRCKHDSFIRVIKQPASEHREDTIRKCAVCGYSGQDPVREVIYGTDGPHSVIATTLYQQLPEKKKKVLAFADGRQEAAFFAWYLEHSYGDILRRNVLADAINRASNISKWASLKDVTDAVRDGFRERGMSRPNDTDLHSLKDAWKTTYREFLTDTPRISLEGVGLVRWVIQWPKSFSVPEYLKSPPWNLSDEEILDLILVLLNSMRKDRAVELSLPEEISLHWDNLALNAAQIGFRIGPPAGQHNIRSWDGNRGMRIYYLSKVLQRKNPDIVSTDLMTESVSAARAIWQSIQDHDHAYPQFPLLRRVNDTRRLNPDWWRARFIDDGDIIYRCDTCGRIQPVSILAVCMRKGCPGTVNTMPQSKLEPNHYRMLYQAKLPGPMRVEEHTAQLDSEKAREFQRDFRDGKIHVLSCSTTFELGVDLGDLDTIFLRNVPPEAFNYAQRVGRAGRRTAQPGYAITYCKRSPHDLYHYAEPQRMLLGKAKAPVLAVCNEKIITRHLTAVALSFFFRKNPHRFKTVKELFINCHAPCGLRDVRSFLDANRSSIENAIRDILPVDMRKKMGFNDGSWLERIAGKDSRFAIAETEISSDYGAARHLEEESSAGRNYDMAKWAKGRAETIEKEDVLSFLSRKAVIPKYGFPVDVVELELQRTQQGMDASDVALQRDLKIAIAEFAPSSVLVANKKEWKSYALKKVAEREWPKRHYVRCHKHNAFVDWQPGASIQPLPCGCDDHSSNIKTYIIPQFGFVTKKDRPAEPKARPMRIFSTRPYFAGRIGPEPESISIPREYPLITMEKRTPGRMVVLCEGRSGKGFYICGACGAGFQERQRPPHSNPQGQRCEGTLEHVSLGHEFNTDVIQLKFLTQPKGADLASLAFSLAYALVEGAAEVLEIPSGDLNAAVGHIINEQLPPIVLYDDVPGGAGLVAQLESEKTLKSCLEMARWRVNGKCGCGADTSCYGCLRNYRNQFIHDKMQRGKVKEYLERLLQHM